MFVILVDFKIHKEHTAGFLPLVQKQANDSLVNENGCVRFDVCHDLEAVDTISLYEIYKDESAFEYHLDTPHFKGFDHNTKHMVKDKKVRRLALLESGADL